MHHADAEEGGEERWLAWFVDAGTAVTAAGRVVGRAQAPCWRGRDRNRLAQTDRAREHRRDWKWSCRKKNLILHWH